jgi:hypothetical protein
MPETKEIRILLEEAELGPAVELAQTSPLDYRIEAKAQVIDPITAVLIGGGVLMVAKFVFDVFDKLKGGVVVDLRQQPLAIKRNKQLPAGWVLVLAADGTVSIETHDAPKDTSERLLAGLIEGALGTAKEVASRATELFGVEHVKLKNVAAEEN